MGNLRVIEVIAGKGVIGLRKNKCVKGKYLDGMVWAKVM